MSWKCRSAAWAWSDEQCDGTVAERFFDRHTQVRRGQRAQAEQALAPQTQCGLRRDQHAHAGRTFQQGLHQGGDRLQQVLGVVQHEQHAPLGQCLDERCLRVAAGHRDAEFPGDDADQQGRVGEGRQFDPGRAVRRVALRAVRAGQGQGRLADAASTDHGDQPVLLKQPLQRREIVVAPEHARWRRWQGFGHWRRGSRRDRCYRLNTSHVAR